jgi:RNA polymerase sigma factor (sigma-70 family)
VRGARAYRRLRDSQLAALVSERDAGALEALYERHGALAYALVRAIVEDDTLVQRVVQDVFVALWNDPTPLGTDPNTVAARLMAATRQEAIARVRRQPQARRGSARSEEPAFELGQVSSESVSVAEQRRASSRQALAGLPAPERRALALAYLGGYTQQEVAVLVESPLETVRAQMAAALRELRRELVRQEHQEPSRWSHR